MTTACPHVFCRHPEPPPLHTMGAPVRRAILIGAAALFAIVTSGIAYVAYTLQRPWHLPAPSGPHAIGVKALALVDSSRADPFAGDSALGRELLVWLWYPATPLPGAQPMGYGETVPGALEQLARMLSLPVFAFGRAREVTTHTFRDAPVAAGDSLYPLLLFSHGIGLGTVAQNTVQCEELASHGYVVACIGHTHETCMAVFPDGRAVPADMARWKEFMRQANKSKAPEVLAALNGASTADQRDSLAREYVRVSPLLDESNEIWTADTRFVLDAIERRHAMADSTEVAGRIDVHCVGIFGHSMGGMAAQKTIMVDPRIAAGISYDAPPIKEVLTDSIRRPFMFLAAEQYRGAGEPAFARCAGEAVYAMVRGTTHFNFCDFSLWLRGSPVWRLTGAIGTLDGYRCETIMNTLTRGFFDCHLRGRSLDPADLRAECPEVELRAKRAGVAVTH
ncbi:MAG: hypothetical protein GF331_15085 [Chitinivibrionales bacterium]|nr:hypothetical protein [Chitinivibrionales bacterium]